MVSGLAFVVVILGPAVAAAAFASRGAQLNGVIGAGGVTAVMVAAAMLALNLGNSDSGPFLAFVAAATLGMVSFGLASVTGLAVFALRSGR